MIKCSPAEIIKEVPGIQTLTLPSYWFAELKNDKPVFLSLYDWMLENGRVPQDNKENLHNRTYVGAVLYRKLCAAEKKRLKKKYRIKGDELENALAWVDMDSGPKDRVGLDLMISGDLILVIPESSKKTLNNFAKNKIRKEREKLVRKCRSNAAGATFYQWLLPQVERPDIIGDLARDASEIKNFPQESNQFEEIKSYLYSIGHSIAVGSLKEAWLEYIQQYPERVQKCAWCSECLSRINIEDAFFAYSLESSELFVFDSECLNEYKRFDEIVSVPLSDVTSDYLEELAEREKLSETGTEELLEKLRLWGIIPLLTEGTIYFVKSEKTHEIKIGFTSGPVEKRLRSLQTAHPSELHLLATIPGTSDHERSLHQKFANIRLKGEWFEPHPDLLAFISVIKKG
jgi:uncharacterized protein YozE (UPF0346 family)